MLVILTNTNLILLQENRNCYFGQEFSLKYYKYYTMSNCENECIANITYNECKCIRYYMPSNFLATNFYLRPHFNIRILNILIFFYLPTGSEEEYICGVKKYNCTETILSK